MSIVVGGAIFDNRLAKLLANSPVLLMTVKQSVSQSLTSSNAAFVQGLAPAERSSLVQAYTTALQDLWIFYTCASALGLLASFCIKQKVLSDDQSASKQGLRTEEKVTKSYKREVKEAET